MLISKISINRPVTTVMLSLALVFMGIISYRQLPVQSLPDIQLPALNYALFLRDGNLSPDETNDLMTRPVEKMVGALPNIKETDSWTYPGGVWGNVTFVQGTDVRFRAIELQDRINKWLAGRPEKIVARVSAETISANQSPSISLILSVPRGQKHRVQSNIDLIVRELKCIDGIAQVKSFGGMAPNLVLECDENQLNALGLTTQDLVNSVNSYSVKKQWLGMIQDGRRSHEVSLRSTADELNQLMDIPIDPQGAFRLGRLAHVNREVKERDNIYRINGKEAVTVQSLRRERSQCHSDGSHDSLARRRTAGATGAGF